MNMEFTRTDIGEFIFEEVAAATPFTIDATGRRVGMLVRPRDDGCVPVVRTMTDFGAEGPAPLQPVHDEVLARAGAEDANNVMVEWYTGKYRTMAFHSDMALDIVPGSSICVITLYPEGGEGRRALVVRSKATGDEERIPMEGAITFDTATNRRYKHKIVAADDGKPCECIILTARQSALWVDPEAPCLRLASEDERKQMIRWRGQENRTADFQYPADIPFTLSESDLMPVNFP